MREQKKKRIKDIIINQKIDKNYITGIYNYCDRWCEKCSFTKRCMNYSMGEAFGFDEKDNDLNNKEFWENISMIFEVTAELLVEKAKEFGIDLTKVDEDFVEREERGHPLIDSSHNFSTGFEKWLDANNDTFRKRILLYTETGNKSGTLLSDTVEILYWYTFLIPAKFYKILINKEEGCQEQELIDYENGTIK